MAAELQLPRFSSCRGVSLEINKNSSEYPPPSPSPSPLAITITNTSEGSDTHHGNNIADPDDHHPSYLYWRPRQTLAFYVNTISSSAKVLPHSPAASLLRVFSRTHNRPSSHFCDLDIEDEEEKYEDNPPSIVYQRHEDIEHPPPVNSANFVHIPARIDCCNEDYKQNSCHQHRGPASKVSAAKPQESRLAVKLLGKWSWVPLPVKTVGKIFKVGKI